AAPLDGEEKGREAWCGGGGDVYVSGTGTALAKVNASGAITSLNVSSYDRLSDIDVAGGYIYAGGGRESGYFYSEDEGYLKKFTLDGTLVWNKTYVAVPNFGADVRDVEVVGETVVGLQTRSSSENRTTYLLTWNATTGDAITNVSLGVLDAAEMQRIGQSIYVAGRNYTQSGAVLLKAGLNGTVEWKRWWTASASTWIRDLCVVGDAIYLCGYIAHPDPRGMEGYVTKWSTSGVHLWNYTWEGGWNDNAEGIATDGMGVYVTGQHPDTSADLFVMALRPDGRVPAPAIATNASGTLLSGDGILFTAGGTWGDGPGTMAWDFGDGTNATGTASPVHAFAAGGTYNVTLTVTDVDNSTAVASVLVSVEQDVAPDASFVASSTTVYTGTAVRFDHTGTAGNGPASFLWTFGAGGPTGAVQNATHAFTAAGTYNVSLVVTDADGDVGRASVLVAVVDRPPGPPGTDPWAVAGAVAAIAAGTAAGLAAIARARARPRRHPGAPAA
ncbi:MAG: PKD domain-containing protein, partial [Candidatus Lokiarchaeota archaeon]|nr:PKD domain-containing protein [Candidatus Lokiarchaeota archaeon]